MPPIKHRTVLIVLIAGILICCTASAVLGIRSGHSARAASTFFAGLAFAAFFATRLVRRSS